MLQSDLPVCTICQAQNRAGVKYCSRCGTPLGLRACPHCGGENRVHARRCRHCGKPMLLTGHLPRDQILAGRYRVIQIVARSGMGAIYQVADVHLPGKVWALKEMSESVFTTAELPRAIDMFRQEMRILAACQHPNLPQIGDFFTQYGKSFIVMEYINGMTLDAVLKSTPGFLPVDTVLSWGDQLCAVLGYLHSQNPAIIHRDIKPLNIMLEQRSGLLKLIDFGIARFQLRTQPLVTGGELKGYGTAGYAPPEQFSNGTIDTRTDLYALGVTLHQLLTRHDPIKAINPFVLPPILSLNSSVPPDLVRVIERATRIDVGERYQSDGEMRKDLRAVRGHKYVG